MFLKIPPLYTTHLLPRFREFSLEMEALNRLFVFSPDHAVYIAHYINFIYLYKRYS